MYAVLLCATVVFKKPTEIAGGSVCPKNGGAPQSEGESWFQIFLICVNPGKSMDRENEIEHFGFSAERVSLES